MLILSVETRLGDCTERMELAFPFHTIQPLVRQPGPSAEADASAAPTRTGRLLWNPNLDEVAVRVSTEWYGLEMSARELSRLKCGDVLMLEANCFDRVEVQLEQRPKFHGRLGTAGDGWAVELTERVKR
jgi:flagellar motor switch protein FliM